MSTKIHLLGAAVKSQLKVGVGFSHTSYYYYYYHHHHPDCNPTSKANCYKPKGTSRESSPVRKGKKEVKRDNKYKYISGSIVTNEVVGRAKARLSSARQKKGYILNTYLGKVFQKLPSVACLVGYHFKSGNQAAPHLPEVTS